MNISNIELAAAGLIDPPPDEVWVGKKKKKLKVPPPALIFPQETVKSGTLEGHKKNTDGPLPIRYINNWDSESLWLNIACVAIVFAMMFFLMGLKTHLLQLWVCVPLAITLTGVICFRYRFYTSPGARKAYVYLDNLSSKIIVYPQGFHFTSVFSTKQPDVVDFQKHEDIKKGEESETKVSFPTQDGYEMVADIAAFWSRRDGEEALSKSLKFQLPELKALVRAKIVGRLSDLGGRNSFESLIYYKAEVARWLANIFGGDDAISPFEDDIGISVRNPILNDLDLTDESRKTFGAKAKMEIIAEGFRDLVGDENAKFSPKEAEIVAQITEGAATRVIHTYQGIPQGARVVALGDSALAVSGKGGK